MEFGIISELPCTMRHHGTLDWGLLLRASSRTAESVFDAIAKPRSTTSALVCSQLSV